MFGGFEIKVAEIALPEHLKSAAPGHIWVEATVDVENNGNSSGAKEEVAAGGTAVGAGEATSNPDVKSAQPSLVLNLKSHEGRKSTTTPNNNYTTIHTIKSKAVTIKRSTDGNSYHDWTLAAAADAGDLPLWLPYAQVPSQEKYPRIGGKVELKLMYQPSEAPAALASKGGEDEDGGDVSSDGLGSADGRRSNVSSRSSAGGGGPPHMMMGHRTSTYVGISGHGDNEGDSANNGDASAVGILPAVCLAATVVDGHALASLPAAKVESLGQLGEQSSALIQGYPHYAAVTSVVADSKSSHDTAAMEGESSSTSATAYFRSIIRYVNLDFMVDPSLSCDGNQFKGRKKCFPYSAMPLDAYAEFACLAETLMARREETEEEEGQQAQQQSETATILSRRSRGSSASGLKRQKQQGPPKPVKLSKRLIHGTLGQLPHRYRWELLTDLNLSSEIVGDSGLPVVLSVVNQCRCLLNLNVDRNSLTLVSAKRLMSELRNHPSLESLSAGHNDFYESAGEEILRLLRVNRKLLNCHLDGNSLSPYLLKRFAKQLEINRQEKDADPFNALSTNYNYLTNSVETLTPEVWNEVKKIWSILSVGSIPSNLEEHLSSGGGDAASLVLSSHPNTGSRIGGISNRRLNREQLAANSGGAGAENQNPGAGGEGIAGASSLDATIPLLATTQLFKDVMNSVQEVFCSEYEDVYIRRLFSEASNAMVRIQPLPTIVMKSEGGDDDGVHGQQGVMDVEDETMPPPVVGETNVDVATGESVPTPSQSRSRPATRGKSAATAATSKQGGDVELDALAMEDQDFRGTFFPQCYTKLVFLPLRVACEYPHRWADCVKIIRCLGKTHRQLGVRPHHYAAASKATLEALNNHLGPTVMGDPKTKAAWVQFFTLVQRIVLSGTGDVM